MKRLVAMLLAVVMLCGVLSACGSKPAASAAPAAPAGDAPALPAGTSVAPSATPTGRTDVNVSINQAWTTCDPHGTTYVQDRIILWQIYEGLLHYNELTGKAEPHLAESYTVNEAGDVYTFKLREDVYFHNGDQMKASDAAFSIMRAADPNNPISMYGTNIKDAKAIDDFTLEVTLASSYAPFIANACQLFIVSEREVTEKGDKFGVEISTAGTGPYMIAEMDNDQKIVLKAFDKYYKGKAPIETVNFYIVTDSAAGMVSFESGDLDWYNCTVTDYLRLQGEGKFNTEATVANHMTFVAINPNSKNEALHKEEVRKAIAYAINKQEMNYAAFDGYAKEADYLESPDMNVGAPKGDVVYNYNPEKVKEMLAAAGYPDGVDVGKIMSFTGSHFEVCATVLQAQLEAVGIHAELEWVEQATGLDRGKKFDYDIYVTGGNCSGDYDNLRKRFYTPLATEFVDFTVSEYDYKWLDNAIDVASSTADPAKRLELNKEINDYFMNTATYLPLLHKCVPFAWNPNLNVVNRPVNPIIYDWSWN